MAKKEKKIDPKMVAKESIMKVVGDALIQAGFSISDGEDFGMTKGTLVIHADACDVQLKPITPKVGVERYEVEGE